MSKSVVFVKTKSIFISKTFWFNIIAMVVASTQAIMEQGLLDWEILALIVTVGNVILRFITKQPVTVTGGATTPVKGA